MSIKVSVIMASYNGEDYIEESVRSIRVQTFKNFELVRLRMFLMNYGSLKKIWHKRNHV